MYDNELFHYVQAGCKLIDTLEGHVLNGKSAVLLGSRFGGKRHMLTRLAARLASADNLVVIRLRLLENPPISSAQQLISVMATTIQEPCIAPWVSADTPLESVKHVNSAVLWLCKAIDRRIVLLVSNVDSMSHQMSTLLIRALRKHSDRISTVFTAEDLANDLQCLPSAEAGWIGGRYVIQGFDNEEFAEFIGRYAESLNIDHSDLNTICRQLYDVTGGNSHLARLYLWRIVEERIGCGLPGRQASPSYLKSLAFSQLKAPFSFGIQDIFFSMRGIAKHPECWTGLQRLLAGEETKIENEQAAPTALEMAGIAIRKGNKLQFASRIMHDLAKTYYTDRRFGLLYASKGQWDQAFEFYERSYKLGLLRPTNPEDSFEVEAAISALCTAMHDKAANPNGRKAVQQLFERGCRLILGFPQVLFLVRDGVWRAKDRGASAMLRPDDDILRILPLDRLHPEGLLPLDHPWNRFAIAAILPNTRRDLREAVVARTDNNRLQLTDEQRELAEQLLCEFVKAYSHATKVERLTDRLKVRDQHVDIVNSIFVAMGAGDQHVDQILRTLKMAAQGLRKLGYRRVFFALVDRHQERIQGVWDDSDDDAVGESRRTS